MQKNIWDIVGFLSGPLVGGIIGWVTNYLALKMLFRPRKPIVICGFTLPFTPGIIPKRKNALAAALGKTTAEHFLTSRELEEVFLSDEMCGHVAGSITTIIMNTVKDQSIETLVRPSIGDEKWERSLDTVTNEICCRMQKSLEDMDITQTVSLEVGKVLKEKMAGPILKRIFKDDFVTMISITIGEHVENYYKENGQQQISGMVGSQIRQLTVEPFDQLAGNLSFDEDILKDAIVKGFRGYMQENIHRILQMFDIAGIIERKLMELQPKQIEDLVYTVIDREMKFVIWLGGLLGVLIGMVNSFI